MRIPLFKKIHDVYTISLANFILYSATPSERGSVSAPYLGFLINLHLQIFNIFHITTNLFCFIISEELQHQFSRCCDWRYDECEGDGVSDSSYYILPITALFWYTVFFIVYCNEIILLILSDGSHQQLSRCWDWWRATFQEVISGHTTPAKVIILG